MTTLRQLETFAWIVRLGSFSAAAKRLNTTQSAISARVSELERGLGVSLFDRSGRHVSLTPKGRQLRTYAGKALALVEEMETAIGSMDALSGTVRLGTAELIALTWLPDLAHEINLRYPQLTVELDVDLTNNLWRKLDGAILDLALLPGPIRGGDYNRTLLGALDFRWMAAADLKVDDGPLRPRDLARYPIVTLYPESVLHSIIEDWFDQDEVRPRRVDVCNSIAVVASLASRGLGLSLLPSVSLAGGDIDGRLQVIETIPDRFRIDFWAVYTSRVGQRLGSAIAGLAQMVSTYRVSGDVRT